LFVYWQNLFEVYRTIDWLIANLGTAIVWIKAYQKSCLLPCFPAILARGLESITEFKPAEVGYGK